MSWPVGTIVVCVDATPPYEGWAPCHPLTENAYYTVANSVIGFRDGAHGPGVVVRELVNPPHPRGGSWSYTASRFRIAESTHTEAGTVRAQETVHV